MKYFKVYFYGSRDPQIVLGKTRSQIARDFKELYGHDAIDEVEPVSREDTEDYYGDNYKKVAAANTAGVSMMSGYNPFYEAQEVVVRDSKDKDADKDADKSSGSPIIDKDSPDANKDGKVDAKDDLNKDGKVDAKDLRIAQLEKDVQIKTLEKDIEELDDPAPEEKMKNAKRLRIKDRGDAFVCLDSSGKSIKEFPYNNKKTMAKTARFDAQRYAEANYNKQIGETDVSLMDVSVDDLTDDQFLMLFGASRDDVDVVSEAKLDKKILSVLKSLDAGEARLVIQGLPKAMQKQAFKELKLEEKVDLDARTKTYRETVKRLMATKQKREELKAKKEKEAQLSEIEEPEDDGDYIDQEKTPKTDMLTGDEVRKQQRKLDD